MITSQTKIYPPILEPEFPSLEAVAGLFQMLHAQGVRYVHWKSNIRLGLSLQGGTDLDLLVDKEHSRTFRQILLQQEIKPILPPQGQRYPGMEHYLGFDPASGKLFHLHVHYQLVLGEEYIKNFRLPLEEYFLQHTRLLHGIFTPLPELELIILAIRVLLKYRDRDGLKDLLSIRSPGIKQYFRKELQWLLDQTSMAQVEQTLEAISSVVPREIVLEFLRTLQTQPRAGLKFISLRSRLRHALQRYQRKAPLDAATQYFQQMWQRRKNFVRLSPASRMTLPEGGITIALVGVDGAGKSTLRKELAHWLSWKMDVHSYYLGSKQPSRASSLSYLLYRALRRSQRVVARALGEQTQLSRWLAKARQASLYRHHIAVGKDRLQRYRAGVGKSTAGSIVIFDRFPLSAIPGANAAYHLDGPQIKRLAQESGAQNATSAIHCEDRIYAEIQAPDAVMLLMVSPQVSLQRKPDHRKEAIEEKYQTLHDLAAQTEGRMGNARNISREETDPGGTLNSPRILTINAERELEAVIQQLKGEIWKLL